MTEMKDRGQNFQVFLFTVGVILSSAVVNGTINQVTYNVHVGATVNTFNDTSQTRSVVECAALCTEKSGVCKSATFHTGTNQCLLSRNGESDITNIADTSYKTVALPTTNSSAPIQLTYKGTEFYTAVMNNAGSTTFPTFWIVSSVPTSVRVVIPYLSIDETLAVNGGLAKAYSATLKNTVDGQINNKGVYISSLDPITVFKRNERDGTAGATIVLPMEGIGQNYVVQTCPPPGTAYLNMLLITSTQDGTQVDVDIAGTVTSYSLNRMETLFRYTNDVTGASVTSSAPVSVQAGNICPHIPAGIGACDNVGETLAPEESFGTQFMLVYMYPRPDYTVGIVAKSDNTQVDLLDKNGGIVETVVMNRGDVHYRQFLGNISMSATSDAGVWVTQYGHSDDDSAVFGDPSMMSIPPWEKLGHSYDVYIPFDELLTVVAILVDDDVNIQLNDTVLVNFEKKEFVLTPIGTLEAVYVYPAAGPLRISHVNAAPFAVFVYGGHHRAEFAFPAGWIK